MKTRRTNMTTGMANPQLMAVASVVLVAGLTVAPAMADVDQDTDLNAAADTAVQQPHDNPHQVDASETEMNADADLDSDARAVMTDQTGNQNGDNRTLELRRQSPAGFGQSPSQQDDMSVEQDRNVFDESDAQSSNYNFKPRGDARIYRNADQQQRRTYVIQESTQAWDQDVSGNHGELRFDQPTTRYRVIQQAAPKAQTRFQADQYQSDAELTDQSRSQQAQPQPRESVEMQIIDSRVIDSSDRRSQALGSIERQQRVEADDSQLREHKEPKSDRRPDSRIIELRRQSPSGYTDNQANSLVDDADDLRRQVQQ